MRFLSLSLIIVIVGLVGSSPSVAQQTDLKAIFKRLNELKAAGDYRAALVEAQKFEAGIKAQFGTDHPNYAVALNSLAGVYLRQAKHAEAETLFKRALAIQEAKLGKDHPEVAATLSNLAVGYQEQGKYAEADALYRRALAIKEAQVGTESPDVAIILDNWADVSESQGKYSEAEVLRKRALAIYETKLGKDDPNVARILNGLAHVYLDQGKYAEAEAQFKRALNIEEAKLGKDHPRLVGTLKGLAVLHSKLGKYAEAEAYYKRALIIDQGKLGGDHPNVANVLNLLGVLYEVQGKYAEAEVLHKRALGIYETKLGKDHPSVATSLNHLAGVYQQEGKYAEAEAYYKRALNIREAKLGKEHPDMAITLNALGYMLLFRVQGRYAEAEGLFKRALAIREKALGENHPDVGQSLSNLGLVYAAQGKYGDAETLIKRALAIREKAFGENHPAVALTANNLASLYGAKGDAENALAYSRRATAALIAHAATDPAVAGEKDKAGGLVEQQADYFHLHVGNLAAAGRKGIEPQSSIAREALEIAQWASSSSTAGAVQQMAVRFAAGSGVIANLVREVQDLAVLWRDRDKRLVDALSTPEGKQNRSTIEGLRREASDIEKKIAAATTRLEQEFPDYAALASPKPLTAEDVQQLLGADEALVFFLTGDKESYIFALTRDGFDWRTIAMSAENLSEKVAAFRNGLDLEKLQKSASKPVLFDLALAHELYVALIGPVEELVKDKGPLLVVPSGPLTSLPFHLLVTAKPAKPVAQVKDIALYRDAAWLIKRQAVSVLPSVASLRALRLFARKADSTKPMVGFGDPIFDPAERTTALAARGATKSRAAVMTRAYSEFWQGASLDRNKLALALPSLLDTADELEAVAAKLGASRSDIHLQRDASETTVKRAALADYRVVYFATHGLLAGDVKGLGEPSLALTIPNQPSELDDGLLTASEVAQLKLNADWVVLSACNTAAGDKPGAEALSGLARAFFYAGAHALLVSHWAVDSDAATRLTTTTFDIMKNDPKLGRAEALRRAMLAYMNDATDPLDAYPAIWAPFVIVGEGAAR
jgi:CHAT domain-containing protein/tetratricopeptide (TPR) repeat protein